MNCLALLAVLLFQIAIGGDEPIQPAPVARSAVHQVALLDCGYDAHNVYVCR